MFVERFGRAVREEDKFDYHRRVVVEQCNVEVPVVVPSGDRHSALLIRTVRYPSRSFVLPPPSMFPDFQ